MKGHEGLHTAGSGRFFVAFFVYTRGLGENSEAIMKISLNSLPLSGKIAVTLFLILLWYGYILAALNTRLAVGTTIESIAEHYEDHSLTKEIEEKGFVEEEVVIEHHE